MSKQIGHVEKIKKVTVVSPNKFGALQTDDEDDIECNLCVPPSLTKPPRMPAVKGRKSWKKFDSSATVVNKQIGNVDKRPPVSTPSMFQMVFHITDANKMLASVDRMNEVGNEVVFNKKKCFIQSPGGRRAHMRRKNGVFVLDVVFVSGDEARQGEIVVDSGAADNVMPEKILEGFRTMPAQEGINFVGADGEPIGNYGRKQVNSVPLEFWQDEFGPPFQGRA